MTQQNVSIIQSLYESFAAGDIPAVLGALDQNVEWREAEGFSYADGNPYIGPNAVLEGIFMRIGSDWENFKVRPEELLDAGDAVVVQGIYSGANRATGQPLRAQFAHIWKLAGGKVVSFQQYTDTRQFTEVMAR